MSPSACGAGGAHRLAVKAYIDGERLCDEGKVKDGIALLRRVSLLRIPPTLLELQHITGVPLVQQAADARRWTPPANKKSLTDKGSRATAKGEGGVSACRVHMTRGSDETQPTTPRPEHLWQRGCSVAQHSEYRA